MTNFTIDNSDAGDIERAIIWQYDDASHIVGIVTMMKDFYDQSTKDFYDDYGERIYLSDPDKVDDFGLAIWGKILGVPRPTLTINNVKTAMSSGLYRKILAGRLLLMEKDATVPNYIEYVKGVFSNKVKVVDGLDMSLSFAVKTGATLTAEESAAIAQAPEAVFAYPAGVKSSTHSSSCMFGLDGQQNNTTATDPIVGGLDESGFNWRLTPKGNWQ